MTDETNIDPEPPHVTGSPESIWLVYGDIGSDAAHSECSEVMWCEDCQYPADVRYLRADLFDAQAAEIQRLKTALNAVDRQLGHDDEDDALRAEIAQLLGEAEYD